MKGRLRWTEEQFREDAAKRSRWQRGSEVVNTNTTSGGVESRNAPAQEDRPRVGKALPVIADARSTPGQPCAHRAGVAPGPLTFILPLPPSVNVLYGTARTGQKFLTAEQRAFRATAATIMHGIAPLAGRLEMHVTLYFANRRRADIDNRLKAIFDACTHGGAYRDDSQIDILYVERVVRPKDDEAAVVKVRELGT